MTNIVNHDFTGANGTTLSSYDAAFVKVTEFTNTFEIFSNRLKLTASGGTSAAYFYNSSPPSADYEVSTTFYNVAGTDTTLNSGVIARASSSQQTMYMARWRPSTGFQLFKFINSATATQLGSSVAQSYGVGASGKVRLRVNGTTISVYRNDETSPIISVTDTGITAAGFAGLWGNNYTSTDGPQHDSWTVDTLDGPATATTLIGPSSGTTGVPSTNFTVGANGTITGTVTITPGDGGDGGTFTPTSVAISSGTPTATFTYTPASTGVKSISISDDGGLTNATPLSYTSNAASSTYDPRVFMTTSKSGINYYGVKL